MRIAINTVCLHGHTLDEALQAAVDAGFREIELLAVQNWKHVEAGKADPEQLLAKAKKLGFRYGGVHAGGFSGTNDKEMEETLSYVKQCVPFAKALGATRLVFTGWQTPQGPDPATRTERCRRFGRGLRELVPIAQAAGIVIALENHYHCEVETLEDYREIFAIAGDSPFLGVTIDTGHFTSSEVDPVEVARVLGPRTLNVHIKDHIGLESFALGHGKTNNAGVVRELARHGYDGPLTVELEVHDYENIVKYVHEAYPYVQKLIDQATPKKR